MKLKEIRWIKRPYSAVEGRVEKYRLFNISYDGITPLKYDDPHWCLRTILPVEVTPTHYESKTEAKIAAGNILKQFIEDCIMQK